LPHIRQRFDTNTEAAYRCADMLDKRAVIMQNWADFATL
jgi:hypothetical protein